MKTFTQCQRKRKMKIKKRKRKALSCLWIWRSEWNQRERKIYEKNSWRKFGLFSYSLSLSFGIYIFLHFALFWSHLSLPLSLLVVYESGLCCCLVYISSISLAHVLFESLSHFSCFSLTLFGVLKSIQKQISIIVNRSESNGGRERKIESENVIVFMHSLLSIVVFCFCFSVKATICHCKRIPHSSFLITSNPTQHFVPSFEHIIVSLFFPLSHHFSLYFFLCDS